MAVLNLPLTDFIIYTPFDKGLKILSINFDKKYTKDLLHSLKFIYFDKMCVTQYMWKKCHKQIRWIRI